MPQEILNAKQKKEIVEIITGQWGVPKDFFKPYVFLKSQKDKIYLSTKALASIDLSKLRIDSIGLYFCTLMYDGKVRVSIEGSQLIGEHARKNVLELNKKDVNDWMQGKDIELIENQGCEGYVLVKYKETGDFLGCGKLKENVLQNFVPKVRRVKELA